MKAPATLNARFVETVTTPGRYGDGRGGYGLCLNVRRMTNGRTGKSWVQRIRPGGKPTYIGLGRYPFVTLAEARRLALANAINLSKGIDPRDGGIPTFAAALDRVLDVMRSTWRNPKSEAQWRASLRDYAGALMPHPVDAIAPGDVLAVLTPIWNAKRETARRVRQRISKVMDWARAEGHRTDNPVDAIGAALPTNGHGREHHKALPYAAVSGALATVQASGAWWATKAAFELLTLTAARSGEVRGMRWSEVAGDVWTVPASRMKVGREHRVPLSPRALDILAEAREATGGAAARPVSSRPSPGGAMSDSDAVEAGQGIGYQGHASRDALGVPGLGERTDEHAARGHGSRTRSHHPEQGRSRLCAFGPARETAGAPQCMVALPGGEAGPRGGDSQPWVSDRRSAAPQRCAQQGHPQRAQPNAP